MYGLLIESIIDFIKRRYGSAVWEKVRKKAKIENYSFSTHQQYSETLFLKTIKCLSDVVEQSQNVIMEELGIEFVNFVSQYGYDRILRVLGRHMRDFLNGLDNLHEYMRFSYPKLKPPSFFVEKENANGLTLHYRSKRKGYLYYVKGQLKQVGKVFYNIDVKIDVISQVEQSDFAHVIFNLEFKNEQYKTAMSQASFASMTNSSRIPSNLPIKSEIFFELFPFHVVFNRSMDIISIGNGLHTALHNIEGESFRDSFNLIRPLITFTWDDIISHTNNVFEMTTIEPVRRSSSPISKEIYTTQSSIDSANDECLKLKGQMLFVKEWDAIIFLATPVLENLEVMFNTGFYINDLSMHDSSRDLVLVGTQQSAELKLALDQEKQKSKALEESMKKLDIEMKRTDQLLYQMIPKKIADRLRSGEPVMNLCEVVPSCTILFSDVVGFTSTCSLLTPMEVVSMLNRMYTNFDKSLEVHNVYKVETIGDAYMVVSGLPERTNRHAEEIIEMGFDMLNGISTLENPATLEPMKIRVGCHSGPAVAGVVGLKMPRYCLFGDTVNTASRMESSSEPMKIHISHSTKVLLDGRPYSIVERGKIEIKGKGEMKTYFVLNKLDENGKPIKCKFMEVFEKYKTNASPAKNGMRTVDSEPLVKGLGHSNSVTFEKKEPDENGVQAEELEYFTTSKISLKETTLKPATLLEQQAKRRSLVEDAPKPAYDLSPSSSTKAAVDSLNSAFRQVGNPSPAENGGENTKARTLSMLANQERLQQPSERSGNEDRVIPVERDPVRSLNTSRIDLIRTDSVQSGGSNGGSNQKKLHRQKEHQSQPLTAVNVNSERYNTNTTPTNSRQIKTLNDLNKTDLNSKLIVNSPPTLTATNTSTTTRPSAIPLASLAAPASLNSVQSANSNLTNNASNLSLASANQNNINNNANQIEDEYSNKLNNSMQSPNNSNRSNNVVANKKPSIFASITCDIL